MYFEGILERAADKASLATQSAEKAAAAAERSQRSLDEVQAKYDELARSTLPELRKESERSGRKAGRFEAMAREMEKGYREEKAVSAALMTRIEHLQALVEGAGREKEGLVQEKMGLEEMVRDLMFTVSGREKIAEMADAEGGSVGIPEGNAAKGGRKKKGKK